VSQAAVDARIGATLGTDRRMVAVHGTRSIRREDLARNRTTPSIEVSPADGVVSLGGRVLRSDPVAEVPLSRRYLLA
jgi:urease subunit alpha